MPPPTSADHGLICDRHFEQAQLVAGVSEDWASVAFFYSAYHAMKRALLEDPVFDDLGELKKLNPHLTRDDRRVSYHKARRNQGRFGVNDLVQILYPAHIQNYERLHQASLRVRYGTPTQIYPLGDIQEWARSIRDSARDGHMRCSPI